MSNQAFAAAYELKSPQFFVSPGLGGCEGAGAAVVGAAVVGAAVVGAAVVGFAVVGAAVVGAAVVGFAVVGAAVVGVPVVGFAVVAVAIDGFVEVGAAEADLSVVGAAVDFSDVVGEEEVEVVGFLEVETATGDSVEDTLTASLSESAPQAARERNNIITSSCPAGRLGMAAT